MKRILWRKILTLNSFLYFLFLTKFTIFKNLCRSFFMLDDFHIYCKPVDYLIIDNIWGCWVSKCLRLCITFKSLHGSSSQPTTYSLYQHTWDKRFSLFYFYLFEWEKRSICISILYSCYCYWWSKSTQCPLPSAERDCKL